MTVENEAMHSISYKLHQCMPHSIPVQPIQYILFTGKNPTYAQAIIKVFAHNTRYCVEAAF